MSIELPEWVENRLKSYAEKFKIEYETVKGMVLDLYNLPFVQTDPQFKNNDMRFLWCLDVLHARLVQQKAVREYIVIPYGATDVRMTKQGPQSRLYAITFIERDKKVNSVILFRGQLADIVRDIQLYYAYRVKLAKSPIGDNVFIATMMTKFDNGQPLPQPVPDLIQGLLGIKKIQISDSVYNLSRKVDKFVDEFDLRAVEGVVLRYATGKRPSGTDWAFYIVTDGSVDQDILTPEGYIIPAQFTVWVPSFMLRYAEDSKLLFVGTLSLTSQKEVQMNAIYVHPIVSIPLTR
jgi:hypothetical protein